MEEMEIDFSPELVENELREIFKLPEDIPCEVINRSREGKISYHVRFNILASEN